MELLVFLVIVVIVWFGVVTIKANVFPERCIHGVALRPGNPKPCSECEASREQRKAEQIRGLQELYRMEEEEKRKLSDLRLQETENIRKLTYLQAMDPIEFEKLVSHAYSNLGWEVEDTPGSGDRGVDAYLRKDGQTVVLQCKRLSSSRVGTPVLRDLLGTIVTERAARGIVVTTSSFTEKAIALARESGRIELVDGHSLLKIINEAYPLDSPVPEEFVTRRKKLHAVPSRCPWCGEKTKRRKGEHGPFYGCTGFPGCRWTMSGPRRGYRVVKD